MGIWSAAFWEARVAGESRARQWSKPPVPRPAAEGAPLSLGAHRTSTGLGLMCTRQRYYCNKYTQMQRGRISSLKHRFPPADVTRGGALPAVGCKSILSPVVPKEQAFLFADKTRLLLITPGFRASYQGEPGTGAEATGLLPLAAPSSPATRIEGGSCQQKEKERAFYICIYTLVFTTGSLVKRNKPPTDLPAGAVRPGPAQSSKAGRRPAGTPPTWSLWPHRPRGGGGGGDSDRGDP